MKKSTFYHAGCSICVSAEKEIISLAGESNVDVIHLGEEKNQIETAEGLGVKSVPALVTPSGSVLHINYGASMEALKA